jgi:hypothetical protein
MDKPLNNGVAPGTALTDEVTGWTVPTAVKQFLGASFTQEDFVLYRLIETYNDENGVKNTNVLYNHSFHRRSTPDLLPVTFERLERVSREKRAGVHFGVCPRFGSGGKYDEAWQIRVVRTLWADIDNTTVDAALEAVAEASVPIPSIVVSSGHGAHFYWILDEPYLIDDVGDPPPILREKAQNSKTGVTYGKKYIVENDEKVFLDAHVRRRLLSPKAQQMQFVLGGLADAIGGDHTGDLSRLLRLPGTLNRKFERNGKVPVPVELIKCEPNLRYPFSAFAQFAERAPACKLQRQLADIVLKAPRKKLSSRTEDKLIELINASATAPVGRRSEADFAVCCCALQRGVSQEDVWARVEKIGKFLEGGRRYFDHTWAKAEDHVRLQILKQNTKKSEKSRPPSKARSASGDEELISRQDSLPEVELPGGDQPISDSAAQLAKLLAAKKTHFLRGGVVVRATVNAAAQPTITPVQPAELASDFEAVAYLVRTSATADGDVTKPAIASEAVAKLILKSQSFRDELPPLRVLSPCPVLVERDGQAVIVSGYDRHSGILAEGPTPTDVTLDEARTLLDELLSCFRFATPGDHARALAAIITPALVLGGWLNGRAPIDLGEADRSQAGKGYRNQITAAIYRSEVRAVTQQRDGVGSIDEKFDAALISGHCFISLDNVRGRLDSPKIESFLTEPSYIARCAYVPNTEIDPRRFCIMMTSNKAEMTIDLANRSSCVHILKQPDGFQFPRYPEGDLLTHVQAQQPRYLGAVFAVIRGRRQAEDG